MINTYLTHLNTLAKSPATIKAYRQALRHFALWITQTYGESFDPAATIPRDIKDWISYQKTTERAAVNTINQRLVALRKFFTWCVQNGHAQTNPVANFKKETLPPRRPRAMSSTDARKLLRQVHKEGTLRDIALIELMLGTGLRVSETLVLHRCDIELNARSGQVIVRQGKGGKYREIPLPSSARAALRPYLSQANLPPDALLWQGQRGSLVDPSTINRMLEKYCLAANIPPTTPHQLRHTFATRYLEANPSDLRGLAAILGHASLDTVMIYTEPTNEALAERIERI